MAAYGWGAKNGRAYLVNEAHALRKPVVRQLLVLLERLPQHVVIVFTTTSLALKHFEEGTEDAGPLFSRCLRVELEEHKLTRPFAEWCQLVAQIEGLDGGHPIERYMALARNCRCNLRQMLNAIEFGELLTVSAAPAEVST